MSTYNETCANCNTELTIDNGDIYGGGLRDYEIVLCPKCKNPLTPVYTSGIPHVYYARPTSSK